jgi:hypothetical protein
MAGRAQGTWLPPVNFQGNYVGCGGNDAEAVYAIHANVIPVGSHRDKVLIWDASKADLCHLVHGFIGDRDQPANSPGSWSVGVPRFPCPITSFGITERRWTDATSFPVATATCPTI